MSQPKATARLSVTDQTHPGWLLTMPDGWPYAWRAYDEANANDEVSALAQLVPDDASRKAMLAKGWTLQGGEFSKLFVRAGGAQKASA